MARGAVKAPGPSPSEEHRFAKATNMARVREPFTVPRLNLPAVMTLVPYNRAKQIEADVLDEMERRLKIPLNAQTEEGYELERAARYLAEAVIDPDSITEDGGGVWRPLGSIADWQGIDADIIGDCWRTYGDVRAVYDPISVGVTQEEIELIDELIKKNSENPTRCLALLRSVGVRKLSSYLLSTASRLAGSTIPESSPGQAHSD